MKASFSFLADLPLYLNEKPYELWLPEDQMPAGLAQSNCKFVVHPEVEIEDVRKSRLNPSLDSAGFQYLNDPLKVKLTTEDLLSGGNSAIQEYLLDTAELVRKYLAAEKAICFDWRYRKNRQTLNDQSGLEYDPERRRALQPAQHVHSDDSPDGGRRRLPRHLNENEMERFNSGTLHIRFINLWRPLVAHVEDSPLALCDRRTVLPDDLVACDKVHPDHTNEGIYLKYNSTQRWYWLSGQSKDEPVMFVTWDSDAQLAAAGPPHTAFQNPEAGSEVPLRESIEVRLMVLDSAS
jgi:hypothetical protein